MFDRENIFNLGAAALDKNSLSRLYSNFFLSQIALNSLFFMLFLMEVRKIQDFHQRGRSGLKEAPLICLNNEVNLRFKRYLHNTVINLGNHSILSILNLIFRFRTIRSKIAAKAKRLGPGLIP